MGLSYKPISVQFSERKIVEIESVIKSEIKIIKSN